MKFSKNIVLVFIVLSLILLAGCGPAVKMAMNLSPESETVYKYVTETGKAYEFTQPSLGKSKIQNTGSELEMVFSQKVTDVDSDGTATAVIEIQSVKAISTDKSGTDNEFNTTNDKELAKIVGGKYTIKIAKNGQVEVVDASAARGLVRSGMAKKIVAKLLSKGQIKERHQVVALIGANAGTFKQGQSWSSLAVSPKGMLKSKSFEKIYTVESITETNGQQIAMIKMDAKPSAKPAPGQDDADSKMGFFANMFDETDTYTGTMLINLTTGEIMSYNETLNSEWVAAEPSDSGDAEKGPDQLVMGFNHSFSIEVVK